MAWRVGEGCESFGPHCRGMLPAGARQPSHAMQGVHPKRECHAWKGSFDLSSMYLSTGTVSRSGPCRGSHASYRLSVRLVEVAGSSSWLRRDNTLAIARRGHGPFSFWMKMGTPERPRNLMRFIGNDDSVIREQRD